MQAVLKEIIEKLEERTRFLSDCTKYGNKTAKQQEKSYAAMMMYEVSDLVDDLIDIVRQASKNYNATDSWIPRNERLPERLCSCQMQEYPVTMRTVNGKLKGDPFTSHANFDHASGKWMVKGYEVLAWKEPDKPYLPKDECRK